MGNKQDIINNLNILAIYWKQEGDVFRNRAYEKAIISLKNLDNDNITSVNQVKDLPGFGKTMIDKIKEYLETGQIRKAIEVKLLIKTAKKPEGTSKEGILALFQTIPGVGKPWAEKFWDAGMRNFDDLRKNPQLMQHQQRVGLEYYDDLQKRIPRDYIYIFELMCRALLNIEFGESSYTMIIAGSYRRKLETSGDIDMLITSNVFSLKDVANLFIRKKIIVANFGQDDKPSKEKYMCVAHCPSSDFHFHMDIVMLPEDEWGSGLLWFTGSKTFNVELRYTAKKKGYTLNQHGLFKRDTGERIPVFTEKEILAFLGKNWIPPEKR